MLTSEGKSQETYDTILAIQKFQWNQNAILGWIELRL